MNKYKQHSKVDENHYLKVSYKKGLSSCIRKKQFETLGDAQEFIKKKGYDNLRIYP